ncbi:MAG: glycosyltransferase [Candidatus Paceibacterota bacterium]|jgi:glycosyltransferase involved in cell wall biosynthesis
MKLLVVTQTVDIEDPVLGFFVRWVEELAKRVDYVQVICLREGEHTLPENVRVHSLGKEKGVSHIKYIFNFYTCIWRLRHDYDTVFVHMNPEYIVLSGLLWRVWGKNVAFWYNHPKKNIRLSIASLFARKIFYTSPYAATAKIKKAKRMSAGIDTEVFKLQPVVRNRQAIYIQGRIMPSKHIQIACESLRIIREIIPAATLTLVGPEDRSYGKELRKQFSDLIESGAVYFAGPKQNTETPSLFSYSGVSVNLAAYGHFDKSVLESMACETPVVLSSQAFSGLVPLEWIVPENDPQALAETLIRLMQLSDSAYTVLGALERSEVIRTQSLSELADSLMYELGASMAS